MGPALGKQSVQRVSAVADVVSGVTISNTQQCVSVRDGENSITIDGDYNSLRNIRQYVEIDTDDTCVQSAVQRADVRDKIAQDVAQSLSEKTQALWGALNGASRTQTASIASRVRADVALETVQQCFHSSSLNNNIAVVGSGNTIRDVVQRAVLREGGRCLLDGAQGASLAVDVTDSMNQRGEFREAGPFDWIADAVASIGTAIGGVIAIIIAVVVAFGLVRGLALGRAPAPGAPAPAGGLGAV